MDTTPFLDRFAGFTIYYCSALAGGKKAIIQGKMIYVSPAMYDLISHADTEDELKRILQSIETFEIPEIDWSNLNMPMTVEPPPLPRI